MLTQRQLELRETILLLERHIMEYKVWVDQLSEEMGRPDEEPDLSVYIKAFEEE